MGNRASMISTGQLFAVIAFHSEHSRDKKGQLKNQCDLLSSREMEVLQLVAEGMANKNIATSLKISIKTVEKHRNTLKQKLDIYDTAGLTCYAIKTGIIKNNPRDIEMHSEDDSPSTNFNI